MSYQSQFGRRANESASKNMHSYIINDPLVKDFLKECTLPPRSSEIDWQDDWLLAVEDVDNPIKYIVALDGGYTDTLVRPEFPSARMAFFQFGALLFSIKDLDLISTLPFIDPSDIQKLKQIERFKFALPTKNIIFQNARSLTISVRQVLHNFFKAPRETQDFYSALKWLIFREYTSTPDKEWNLSQCPLCQARNILVERQHISANYTFQCNNCHQTLYLIDLLRLHEAIDDDLGAGGILGYLIVTLEQLLLVYLLKIIIETKPSILQNFLFIKDGPLAFFGQTANLHKPMRELMAYVSQKHSLYLVGIEKSGPFVEHAIEINNRLKSNHVLILNNEYIYKYIIPGNAEEAEPYGRTTYYGNKIIYKSHDHHVYVATLPTNTTLTNPCKTDFYGLDIICKNLARLKCDSYDSALIPVALANKLVSLSNRPSATILGKFARNQIE